MPRSWCGDRCRLCPFWGRRRSRRTAACPSRPWSRLPRDCAVPKTPAARRPRMAPQCTRRCTCATPCAPDLRDKKKTRRSVFAAQSRRGSLHLNYRPRHVRRDVDAALEELGRLGAVAGAQELERFGAIFTARTNNKKTEGEQNDAPAKHWDKSKTVQEKCSHSTEKSTTTTCRAGVTSRATLRPRLWSAACRRQTPRLAPL